MALIIVMICAAFAAGFLYALQAGATTTTLGPVTSVYPFSVTNTTSTISARVGEIFAVQLSSNAGSTGYDWSVSNSGGIQYLNYTVVSTSTLIGGPQVRYYFFHALTVGSQTIILQDRRSFAPGEVAATINITVDVA